MTDALTLRHSWLLTLSAVVAAVLPLVSCSRPAVTTTTSPVIGRKLTVAGHLNVSAGPGNITDVWAQTAPNGRAYAYLGSFDRPSCSPEITGIHIVDITEPASAVKVGFLPCPEGTRANDVKVGRLATRSFRGDLLVHSIELCAGRNSGGFQGSPAGVAFYDVSDPLSPLRLAPGFSLDFQVHNLFLYQQGQNAYVLVVEDGGAKDFHILDVTDPANPGEVAALGWRDWFSESDQLRLGSIAVPMLHDVWAMSFAPDHPNSAYAGKIVGYLAYWDAGLVLLDITDPASPVFLGHSDYSDPDPLTGRPPEGNSHVSVPTEDGKLVFMGDEDFGGVRSVISVRSGEFAGEYEGAATDATLASATSEAVHMSGQAVFIGQACGPVSAPPVTTQADNAYIAVIQAGDCPLEDQVGWVAAAGYSGAILVLRPGGQPQDVVAAIPVLFVTQAAGRALLGMSPDLPAETAFPPQGTAGEKVTIEVFFDGWGYGRILDVSDPAGIVEVGQFAIPEAVFPETMLPRREGDYSMHNVIVRGRTAYISWYAGGIRVVDFSNPAMPVEAARFVDEVNGSDFWGVYVYDHPNGKTYILGSDRNTGLWVFEDIKAS